MLVELWLIYWVANALTEWTIAFCLGTFTWEPMPICPGQPQCSPTSPVLFNIYTTTLAKIQPAGLRRAFSLADGVLLYQTRSYSQEMITDMHSTLETVSEWCQPQTGVNQRCQTGVRATKPNQEIIAGRHRKHCFLYLTYNWCISQQ